MLAYGYREIKMTNTPSDEFAEIIDVQKEIEIVTRVSALRAADLLRKHQPELYRELRDMYHKPSQIGRFLMARTHHLGGETPLQQLAKDDAPKVRWLIDYINSGVYS
jgi:hypothetical protein